MADNDIEYKFKLSSDTSGADKVNKSLEKTGKKAEDVGEKAENAGKKIEALGKKTEEAGKKTEEAGKKTDEAGRKTEEAGKKAEESGNKAEEAGDKIEKSGKKAEESGKKASSSFGNLEKSVGLVKKVLAGFGVGALFVSVIDSVGRLIESFGRAEQKAREMQEAAADKAFAESISDLADSYEKLNAQLAAAAQKEHDVLEIIDLEVKARRDLQESKLAYEEAKELAGVDENAEDAEEQKKVIIEKYNRIRSGRAASDKVEDLVLQRQKYSAQAKNDDKAAESKEKEAEDLERKARQVKAKAENEGINAVSPNEKDKSSVARYFGEGVKQFFTLDWGRMGSYTTAEGDAEREKHKAKQEELEKQAEDLRKQADAAREEAKSKRESADQNRRRMEAMNGSVEAAKIAEGTVQVKSEKAEKDASLALQKKRDEEARRQHDLNMAQQLLVNADYQKSKYLSQIRNNNEQIADNKMLEATGKKPSALAARAIAELEQDNAKTNELLSALLESINKAKQTVERANQRMRNAQGVDSTEGA